jgi:hypothetical protein
MGTVLWFSLAAIRLRAQALLNGVADPKGIHRRAASTEAIGGLRENLRPGLPCLHLALERAVGRGTTAPDRPAWRAEQWR